MKNSSIFAHGKLIVAPSRSLFRWADLINSARCICKLVMPDSTTNRDAIYFHPSILPRKASENTRQCSPKTAGPILQGGAPPSYSNTVRSQGLFVDVAQRQPPSFWPNANIISASARWQILEAYLERGCVGFGGWILWDESCFSQ